MSTRSGARYLPILLPAGEPAVVQYARPTSTVSAGGWTAVGAASLHAALNDETANDATYIQSANDPSTDVCEVALSSVGTPDVDTGHVVRYRYLKNSTATINLTVALVQGTTVIADQLHSGIADTVTAGTFTLTEVQAGNITSYSDLRLRFTANMT